jgi:hypothetical protein
MKATKYLENVYNPITLKLVFETQTEFETFRWAMSYNESLSELAYPMNCYKAGVLSDTMENIHNEMKKSTNGK